MGKALKAIVGIAITAVGFVTGNFALIMAGLSSTLSGINKALSPSAKSSLTPFDPKSINADPAAPRKMVLGRTVFPVDLRYAEPSGTNQEYIDYVFALAAHKSDAIESIYIEDDLAWDVSGGAQGKFVGYLTIEVILEAGSGAFHTVNAGTTWGSTTRLTGCTTMKVRVKRSDNSKTSQSPFASGISGRWSVIGRGMPVYDPAQDSTVAGGSGSQRADNNATWVYAGVNDRGDNPALQLLSFLLGWKIGGRVSVGVGLPADVIDVASFATAAAICDESVALAGGGSHHRYEAGRAFADSDDPLGVVRVLLDSMNGELVDDGGRLSLRLAVNDLTAAFTLTDDDFVSGYEWRPAAPIDQQYTVVRGRYSQPDAPALFGLVDYPEVDIPRTSLAPRVLTLELGAVQDQRRAERIAKQAAVRNLYQGTFTVTLGARGWLLRRNMVVAVTSNARGWTAKLFRVRSLTFNADATVAVTLREENAAIYAWSSSESAVVTPVAPVVFDSRKAASWLMADIAPGADVTRATVPDMPKGNWASGVAFVAGDIAFDANASWTANTDHTSGSGNRPGVGATWTLLNASPDTGNLGTSGSVFFNTGLMASTSYGAAASTLTIKAGAGGIVDLGMAANVSLETGSSGSAAAKVQRETSPGTWADVGSEVTSTTVTTASFFASFDGAWQATGLTNGTSYNFRILGRRVGGAGGTEVLIDGILSGAGR